jgi:hypothetical protein
LERETSGTVSESGPGPCRRERRGAVDEADAEAGLHFSTKPGPSAFSAPKCAQVIKQATEAGIKDIVIQQFEIGRQIISKD